MSSRFLSFIIGSIKSIHVGRWNSKRQIRTKAIHLFYYCFQCLCVSNNFKAIHSEIYPPCTLYFIPCPGSKRNFPCLRLNDSIPCPSKMKQLLQITVCYFNITSRPPFHHSSPSPVWRAEWRIGRDTYPSTWLNRNGECERHNQDCNFIEFICRNWMRKKKGIKRCINGGGRKNKIASHIKFTFVYRSDMNSLETVSTDWMT